MRKIKNPFIEAYGDNYHCFGCSPSNKIGLNLNFFEKDGVMMAEWEPSRNFEGYHNVLHGGIQATMHDEIASWAVYTQCETAGVTSNLNVSYHHPLYLSSNKKITLKAVLKKQEERKAVFETEIINEKGQVCSSAVVEYFLFPKPIAERKYFYPGKDAFFE
jgi:uncharacterized protein (TIGR00369 family)